MRIVTRIPKPCDVPTNAVIRIVRVKVRDESQWTYGTFTLMRIGRHHLLASSALAACPAVAAMASAASADASIVRDIALCQQLAQGQPMHVFAASARIVKLWC